MHAAPVGQASQGSGDSGSHGYANSDDLWVPQRFVLTDPPMFGFIPALRGTDERGLGPMAERVHDLLLMFAIRPNPDIVGASTNERIYQQGAAFTADGDAHFLLTTYLRNQE